MQLGTPKNGQQIRDTCRQQASLQAVGNGGSRGAPRAQGPCREKGAASSSRGPPSQDTHLRQLAAASWSAGGGGEGSSRYTGAPEEEARSLASLLHVSCVVLALMSVLQAGPHTFPAAGYWLTGR